MLEADIQIAPGNGSSGHISGIGRVVGQPLATSFFTVEIVVDQALGNAGFLGNLLNSCSEKPLGSEQLRRGIKQFLFA
jgi:hypothetical protein